MNQIFTLGILFGMVLAYFGNELSVYVNSKIKSRKNTENSIKKLSVKVSIQNELVELIKLLNCDRVAIISYSFETESASMNYETCKNGVPDIIQSFQNIKTTKMIPMLLTLEQKGFVAVDKTSDNETKLLHANIGIVSSYKYKIGETIESGCLVVAYGIDHELEVIDADNIFQTVKKLKDIYEC